MLNFPKEPTFDGKDRGGTRLPEEQNRQTPRAFRTGSLMREPRWGKGKANSAEQWATIYFQLDPPQYQAHSCSEPVWMLAFSSRKGLPLSRGYMRRGRT